jgi:hypothetical protein
MSARNTIGSELADALGATLEQVDGLRQHKWDPQSKGVKTPAVVIDLPDIDRRRADEKESELLGTDRTYRFPVTAFFDATGGTAAQERASNMVDAMIDAVDADPTLGGPGGTVFRVEDAVLTSFSPQLYESQKGTPVIWSYRGLAEVRIFVT